ncbi:hypothetical protein P9079_02215, partial [Gallibacterium anatis]|uniref:hypothetical protein n=1 Tax=Gallibacterium anatis TaxID=750 RepID=UPI0030079E74
HHYLKGKAREKRQSKKTTPFLSNDFGKMGLSAVWGQIVICPLSSFILNALNAFLNNHTLF